MSNLKLYAAGLALAAGFAAAMLSALEWSVESAVSASAVGKAQAWGAAVSSRLPDLAGIADGRELSERETEDILSLSAMDNVLRFGLFDSEGRFALRVEQGRVHYTADLWNMPGPAPFEVARTGRSQAEVHDGRDKVNRPDVYARAFVPLRGPGGALSGVAKVYVDQTETANVMARSGTAFAAIVSGASLLAFGTFTWLLAGQRRTAELAREDADYLSRFDPLTGLLNRREFFARAATPRGRPDAVAFLDLDRFKEINDAHGHAAGDAFLVHVAEALREAAGPRDLVARLGGDEFVIAFYGRDRAALERRARDARARCRAPFEHDGRTLSGTISAGMNHLAVGEDLDRGLAHADIALYAAKAGGRDDLAIYGDEMSRMLDERRRLERRLRAALDAGELGLHFQPLVSADGARTVGFEALARLDDEDGVAIPPDRFITLAEELRLVSRLGDEVLARACRAAASWPETWFVAVNLSAEQFRDGGLPERVRAAMETSGISPSRLELEITETALLEDADSAMLQIDALKEMGVTVAMDDFGTGFSSLSYLWRFGFDRIKIDRSFVAALDDAPEKARQIIETIVILGRRMDMKVTAEGVETEAQAQLLRELGCDVLQGFLYGRARPLEQAEARAAG